MRLSPRILLRSALLAFAATGLLTASASASPSDVVGHVYVNDNAAGTNTVAAFNRHADGTLTPVPGSPFDTGGAGTGVGIGSQGALQVSDNGRYLLAVDAGSNQVSVLSIEPGGGLRLLPGGVVGSGGVEPVSIAVHHRLVYVANAGGLGSNYTGFRLSRSGRLRPLAGSTFALLDGAQPGDVLFNGNGTNLVGTRVGSSQIDSFRVGRGGRLTPAPGSPFAAQGLGPFGSEFRPTNPTQLFVSNAHNTAPNSGTVSAYDVSADGTLNPIGGSPFADEQMAPCWVEITHDGRFLFTVNTATPSISRYAIAPSGRLILLGSTPFKEPTGLGPEDARLSPGGGSLWVVGTTADVLIGFKVDGSQLSEFSSSPTPLPAGAPFGVVVN
jgi:6-phosphogluconolactonase